MQIRREVIAVKVETTYGTDAVPTAAANAVLVENPSWSFDSARLNDRNGVRTTFATLLKVFGGALKAVSFDAEMKGSGTAGTAPEIDALLRACGFAVTNVPATSDTYKPTSSSLESVSIYYWQDGTLHKMLGCVGTVSFKMEAGKIAYANFQMVGHEPATSMLDQALPTPTYDATVPPPVIGGGFTIGGTALVTDKLEFAVNNQIAKNGDISSYDGFAKLQITGRDLSGSFAPEAVLKATKDFDTPFKAGTTAVLASGVIGSTAGNRFAVNMPVIQYREFGPGDRGGIRVYEMGFGAHESAGDDEVSIAFT